MSFRGSVNKKKVTSASAARHFRKATSEESSKEIIVFEPQILFLKGVSVW
jgi:hypothetical protein